MRARHNDEQAASTARGLHGEQLSHAPKCMSVRAAMYCHTPAMLRSHIDDTRKMASGSGSQNQNVLLCTQSLPILLSLVKDRTHDNHCFQQEHAIPVLENVCQIQQCSHKQNYANDNAYEYSDAQKSF